MQRANLSIPNILRSKVIRAIITGTLLLATSAVASAGGPRWVSGPPYFTNWRVMISWYTSHPLYFTDAGDLSPSVNHAAADAMVAQAAAVWNVPTASLVLQKAERSTSTSVAQMCMRAQTVLFFRPMYKAQTTPQSRLP